MGDEINQRTRESVNKLKKKAFVAVLTRAKAKKQSQIKIKAKSKQNKGGHLQSDPPNTWWMSSGSVFKPSGSKWLRGFGEQQKKVHWAK